MIAKEIWNTARIAEEMTKNLEDTLKFEDHSIYIGLLSPEDRIGVGVNHKSEAFLILPGQLNVTSFTTKFAAFDPWMTFKDIGRDNYLENVSVLSCKYDRNNPENINAIAATFYGLIDLQQRFGSCGLAIWQMKSLFEAGFLIQIENKNLIGIAGEMIFMLSRKNKIEIFKSWHSKIDDKYDFSSDEFRLDVKTTLLDERIHHFSSSQVPGAHPEKTYIASVKLSQVQNGLNFSSLVNCLLSEINSEDHESVLTRILATIQAPPSFYDSFQIDFLSSMESVRIYEVVQIPSPKAVENVLTMNWKSTLEKAEPLAVEPKEFMSKRHNSE